MTPVGELDVRYSSPGAAPTPWAVVDQSLQRAEIYWISTSGLLANRTRRR